MEKSTRNWLLLFITGLTFSGITAFPIETELKFLTENAGWLPKTAQDWVNAAYTAVKATNNQYPYLSYGTDWLAFAHLVLAVSFIGPLKDPVRNIWVVQFGMIACVLVLPLAFIAGPVRHIPFFWRLVDCSFGVFGIIPLYITYRKIKRLETLRG
ncbi:hypothetical protein GS398_17525 [Pedobacter sp. HMF7056]|uniref:Uncharacterized protein n=1 Tax=Hufsiella ginkgonis TaxID=2695274 RepID=A0A7K1Y1I1_9SPHI|nr:hypothetical protein [Hufsiella ginkgonis]